ncbi:hypothetical protein AJ79_00089 [Helicocarpus griseus UAMH5409]|uniref:Uncharacterized protein n=1 Tax=Helicocarpus griseus UAMH5409 TaxID=1447875 RepID=A0A2B7YCR0_9EURO|nr:hypothetical protein AJ79_00089 [Helicocarpus griseus UAMH5409]
MSENVDDEACFDLRRNWASLRYEAIRMYRQFELQGVPRLPESLEHLLTSCGDCVNRLSATLKRMGHPDSEDEMTKQLLGKLLFPHDCALKTNSWRIMGYNMPHSLTEFYQLGKV